MDHTKTTQEPEVVRDIVAHTVPEGQVHPQALEPQEQSESVLHVMNVEEAVALPHDVQLYRGTLREPADKAYEELKRNYSASTIPLLQEDQHGRKAILLLPKSVEQAALEKRTSKWKPWVLFLLTLLTTTFAGALHQGVNLLRQPERFAVGLPYALALLAILGCHELGHFFTARRYRMNVTPPYFIPVPFALGTFGAFIQMRSPAENRRSLFDVAIAGPLAGLVVAIPALYFGLKTSSVLPAGTFAHGSQTESSILLSLIIKASLGDVVGARDAIMLSPIAFAGYLGLIVTALNLLPIGQLDGGHIARAMFGTRVGTWISSASMITLFLVALFLAPGLMMWAVLVYFMAGRARPPLNDVSQVGGTRVLLGILAFIILALILIPMPDGVSEAERMSRPAAYL